MSHRTKLMSLRTITSLAVVLALAACGGTDDSDVVVYKYTGSVQCSASLSTQAKLNEKVQRSRRQGLPSPPATARTMGSFVRPFVVRLVETCLPSPYLRSRKVRR